MDSRGIINILNNNGNSIGTGFFASPNGYIVTCYHVLKEANSISTDSQILFKFIASPTIHFAMLGAIDEEKDIAILHSDLTPFVHYAVKTGGKRGERLATLGFPNGDKIGIPADPVLQDYIESGKYIQLKEANTISHGFSGAPLVTEAGLAVGMIVWIPRDDNSRMENIAHAIPSQLIIDAFSVYLKVLDKGIIKQLKTQGPTYNQTPPLETMGGVFAYMGKLRWTRYGQCRIVLSMSLPRALLDILSRG